MITVIAGINGAGKSSIAGAYLRQRGGDYFNPDEVARRLMNAEPALTQTDANIRAWHLGVERLQRAIAYDHDYSFETTLGGQTICQLLHHAIEQGRQVRILFCGLSSPALHIQRVAARVARGGHDIPELKIRERWHSTLHNMMGLIPKCHAVRVFDNSIDADEAGPFPVCLFSVNGDGFDVLPVKKMPQWAKPLAAVAIRRVL